MKIDDRTRFLRLHDRGHDANRTNDIHQIDIQAQVPLLVSDFQNRPARPVAAAVDQHVDAPPLPHDRIDQALQIVIRLIGAGHADTAQFIRQRFAFSGGRENRHLETIRRQALGGCRAQAASAGGNERHFSIDM